jgi:hypothetical protein
MAAKFFERLTSEQLRRRKGCRIGGSEWQLSGSRTVRATTFVGWFKDGVEGRNYPTWGFSI